jgi:outer membrane lipoprotein SlyB
MKYRKILFCVFASMGVLLSACSKDLPPGDYDSSDVGKMKKVVPGVILSKRPVNIHNKSAESTSLSTTENSADSSVVNRARGFEYVIRLNSGAIVSIVQTENVTLNTKQHVLVIYGDNTRVVPDEGSDQF